MGDQELRLISGVVSELALHSGTEEFVLSPTQKATGVGAAVGLAAGGLAGAAAGASIAATSAGDAVEFFSCKLGESAVGGRFSKASFKDGEELQCVISVQDGNAMVLAACRASDQMMWIQPHCSRGTAAHRAFAMRLFGWLLIGLPMFFFAMPLIWAFFEETPVAVGFMQFTGWISLAMGGIGAVHYAIRFYRQWLPIAKQAEAIFAALGYPDPSRVDLPRDHKRYCKANGIEWPYLTDGPWIYHYLDPQQMPVSDKSGISD